MPIAYDIDLDRNRPDALNPLSCAFDRVLFGIGIEMTRQRDHTVLHSDADLGCIDGRIPGQLCADVLLQLCVCFHDVTFSH